jgi:hypothetical protein
LEFEILNRGSVTTVPYTFHKYTYKDLQRTHKGPHDGRTGKEGHPYRVRHGRH